MRIKLSRDDDGIWEEITDPHGNSEEARVIGLLNQPNRYQTNHKFVEQWMVSKLLYGNTYVLKERDVNRNVIGLHVLHPACVKPLIAENGDMYYELNRDDAADVHGDQVTVPATEIIHDMMVSLWHRSIGVSPLYACSLSATMGNNIQNNSTNTFANGGRPSGIIYVPGAISDETALRLKELWQANFGGANIGKTALLADGMKFEAVQMQTAQMMEAIEQLRWTVEDVARAFRYPLWMLGGPMPPYTGPEMAMTAYYSQCLHPHIGNFERCLELGLSLSKGLHTELDLEELMRMDTAALFEANNKAVQGGWMKPNEARFRANLEDTEGGDTPYLQQQNYSLAALNKRDTSADPFAKAPKEGTPSAAAPMPTSMPDGEKSVRDMLDAFDFEILLEEGIRKGMDLE